MTSLGMQLGWLMLQVTALTALAFVLFAWTARREARAAVVVGTCALVLLLALTVVAFSPLPEVCRWSPFVAAAPEGPGPAAEAPAADEAGEGRAAGGLALSRVGRWLRDLSSHRSPAADTSTAWPALAIAYTCCVLLAGVRLLRGWWSVRTLCRRSRPVADVALSRLAEALGAPNAALRECDEPGLAATVGWWRPVILLPPEWRSWTAEEQQAVLAHELAHVRHRDYLIGLLARFCLALHGYHPLVRMLCGRIRCQQEVAADAVAASAVGGRGAYRKTLARLALSVPDRTPARTLPAMSGGTLFRRIAMLNGTECRRPLNRWLRGLLVGVLVAAAVTAATLRTPATPAGAPAQAEPFELGYLAPDVKAFVAVRPAAWLAQPGMEKVSRLIEDGVTWLKPLGVTLPAALRPQNVEQVVANVQLSSQGTGKPGSRSVMIGTSSILIRMNQDFDWLAFFKGLIEKVRPLAQRDDVWKNAFREVEEIRRDGVTLYRLGACPMFGPMVLYFHVPDRRTAVFYAVPKKEDVTGFVRLVRNVSAARKRDWGTGMKRVGRAPFALVLDNSHHHYTKQFDKDLQAADRAVLDTVRFATLGIELGAGRPVRLILDATSATAAAELEGACQGYARLALENLKAGKDSGPDDKLLIQLGTELLKSRRARRAGARLEWVGHSSVRVGALVGAIRPEVK
jgi:hypothetical protein